MGKKSKYYVVWVGKSPGIYTTWNECEKQVLGFEGAKYKSFITYDEALNEFKNPSFHKSNKIEKNNLKISSASYTYPSICVDAACSGNPGLMEYRGVDTKSGIEIFRKGPYPDATNNIGEFLAIVHALAYLKNRQIRCPIYSDSKTALSWIKNKKAKTKLNLTDSNRVVFDLILRAENWLKTNEIEVQLLKWPTEDWGEIPADFGRKK